MSAGEDRLRLVAKGVALSSRVWNMITRDLNTIMQLSAGSANAEQIARRAKRIKRILQGKTPEPQPQKRRHWRKHHHQPNR